VSVFLILAFLFFIGSTVGWVIELFFRRFFSDGRKDKKWINPGLCTGPYLPLYGLGVCVLFAIASMEKYSLISNLIMNRIVLFLAMAVAMTLIEYIAGICSLKFSNVRLWDYRDEWGNIQGIICPKFSFFWAVLGAVYYFCIHSHIIDALIWLSNNLAFSFVIGMFFGVFIIDLAHSTQLLIKLKRFAEENKVIVKYEAVKAYIFKMHREKKKKYNLFRPFHSELPLSEHLKNMKKNFEARTKERK